MAQGHVKNWNVDKGFGFITADTPDGKRDYFAHISKVKGFKDRDGLAIGQQVEFTPHKSDRGDTALDIVAVPH